MYPLYPRGSNGACQVILDGKALGDALFQHSSPQGALKAYEADRTGDKPFDRIEDGISADELSAVEQLQEDRRLRPRTVKGTRG